MSRIPLTIDPNYCADWGWWEGCREIMQNAKDGEEFGDYKMSVQHLPRTNKLVITNANITLEARLLMLLGASEKTDGRQRGKFGEGFAIGTLALVRAGHPVTVYSGDEVWRPAIETAEEGPFQGAELLVFTTRKKSRVDDFSVEIENVSKSVWEATKKLFLFLQPPKAAEVVSVPRGRVLLNPEYKGMVFSKGIYVNTVDGLECGYDLDDLRLDRDRRLVDEWDLKYRLGDVWNQAHKANPAAFSSKVYSMIKSGAAETKQINYHADEKLIEAIYAEFKKEHGEEALPVTSMQDSRDLEAMGQKTVVVDRSMAELLEKTCPKASDVKSRLQSAIQTRHTFEELSAEAGALTYEIDRITTGYIVVTFNDPTLDCRYDSDSDKVALSKDFLESNPYRRDLIRLVAQAEAQRKKTDAVEVLLTAFVKE